MGRREDLQQRHGEMADRVGMDADGGGKPLTRDKRRGTGHGGLLILLLVLIIGGGAAWWFFRGSGQDTDARMAAAAKELEQGVGLVVLVVPGEDGNISPRPMATCWAVDEHLMVTNAHVVESVRKCLEHDLDAYVAINRRPDLRLRIVDAWAHPRYGETRRNISGDSSLDFTYDVGLLRIEGEAPATCPVADEAELHRIASGYRVAYLGFPQEGLAGGGLDIHSPVANMQSGIVTAVSDFWQGDAGAEGNVLIRHNLGATGGSSGSPLFNANGEVVGILNGGNITAQVVLAADGKATVARAPSAAMINFAQRVDLLGEISKKQAGPGKAPRIWQTDAGER